MTRFANYNGNLVSYKSYGKGKLLYLVHGFCSDERIWSELIPLLEKDFQIICPDLPGYGNSPMPYQKLSIALFADAIESIISKENHEQIIFAGHSLGGYVLCELLSRNIPNIEKAIMVNSHPYADNLEKIKNRKKANAFIAKHGNSIYVKELYQNLFAANNSHLIQKHDTLLQAIIKDLRTDAISQSNIAMINRAAHDQTLANCTIPIQFIIGKNDLIIDLNTSLKQSYLPKISDIHILENTGHLTMIESPKFLAENISSFSNLKFDA